MTTADGVTTHGTTAGEAPGSGELLQAWEVASAGLTELADALERGELDHLGRALSAIRILRGWLAGQEQAVVVTARLSGVGWSDIEARW